MKRGWIFVLVVGIAVFHPGSAETNLWRFNSPMDFTSGPEVNVNNLKIWTINSSMQFTQTFTPGIDKGVTSTPGIDKGVNLTPGIAQGITLTLGIDKGINKTLFMCNIV